MKVSNKKNLYVADEDLQWFEKAKELFPDISVSKLVADALRMRCLQKEGELKKMRECTVFRGSYDPSRDVLLAQEFRFYGIEIARLSDTYGVERTVFLTKKGKFLVYAEGEDKDGVKRMSFADPYETYEELAKNIPGLLLDLCSRYLSINSDTRTYELLDI
ncbi:hypothetical protein KP003_06865 [Geomonas nitrogeniifigens]|uniref:hypothetical protein n=1 Tax=Geomonas diazotrophica TaxID=2843197 RepID=UPI001C2CC12B|nr:hypothetical protein [Geomonas nitrogeniifigens]QXE88113.1 hypothetical protein KP003_06865 [Geomonas nitrogeniifigens]